jgi:hypothetical protein
MGSDDQGYDRRIDLRLSHRGRIRLAVAALTARPPRR